MCMGNGFMADFVIKFLFLVLIMILCEHSFVVFAVLQELVGARSYNVCRNN
jgi:hypothetical protein